MAGTKEIKRRIKSVKSTKKITKAMELVAASKMKRAVSATLASRLYAEYSFDVLTSVARNIEEISSPLFVEREVKNLLLILITSNRGLCGAYNAQIIKKALLLIKKENQNTNIHIFELPDYVSLRDIVPISKLSIDEFSLGNYDKVLVAYTDFVSALNQKPNIKQILPVSKSNLKELLENLGEIKNNQEKNKKEDKKIDYLVEGNTKDLIASLAEKLTRMQIYQMLLESNASEQSSRMMAMKNASEASREMIDGLTLMFNKARQANITREISEISAGMVTAS